MYIKTRLRMQLAYVAPVHQVESPKLHQAAAEHSSGYIISGLRI